ncbi:MAG: SgcJ/EcaC family oxidoreductase [Hylemonella sp.]|nr:SgcJ/EcaC family oxidoreductase [Hylemonella sp.]
MTHEPDENPTSTVHAWIQAFNNADPQSILALYAPEAVLWGTFATELTKSRAGLAHYFQQALQGTPAPKVELESVFIQHLGEVAVASGSYLLQLNLPSGRSSLPARYTFVLTRAAGAWLIASHHSSLRPG